MFPSYRGFVLALFHLGQRYQSYRLPWSPAVACYSCYGLMLVTVRIGRGLNAPSLENTPDNVEGHNVNYHGNSFHIMYCLPYMIIPTSDHIT